MSPRRGERATPPPTGGEYDLRFASNQAAEGWEQLGRQAGGNLRRAFDAIRTDPRSRSAPERHHRLKGGLGTAVWKGEPLERWQYEVTGGGRIWYVIDDARQTAWITYAGTGHPKATDRGQGSAGPLENEEQSARAASLVGCTDPGWRCRRPGTCPPCPAPATATTRPRRCPSPP